MCVSFLIRSNLLSSHSTSPFYCESITLLDKYNFGESRKFLIKFFKVTFFYDYTFKLSLASCWLCLNQQVICFLLFWFCLLCEEFLQQEGLGELSIGAVAEV